MRHNRLVSIHLSIMLVKKQKGISQNDEFLHDLKFHRIDTYIGTNQTHEISKP